MMQKKLGNVLLLAFFLMIVLDNSTSSQDKNQKVTSKKSTTSEKNENAGLTGGELTYLDGLLVLANGIHREELSGKPVPYGKLKGTYTFMYPNVFSGIIVKVNKLKTDSTFTQAVNGDTVEIDARNYSISRNYTIKVLRTSESAILTSGQPSTKIK